LISEKTKWTCPECGGIVCAHTGACDDCGRNKF
jgi:predicted ATP-dependent serine protease